MSRHAARRAPAPAIPCPYCAELSEDWGLREAHIQTAHRPRWMLDRMEELNRTATRAERRQEPYEGERREYQRLMSEWWRLTPAEATEGLADHGSPDYNRERPYLRARVVLRNAIVALEQSLFGYRYGRRGYTGYDDQAPELARKAAHALRKVRPDLFEGYQGETIYGGRVDWRPGRGKETGHA